MLEKKVALSSHDFYINGTKLNNRRKPLAHDLLGTVTEVQGP